MVLDLPFLEGEPPPSAFAYPERATEGPETTKARCNFGLAVHRLAEALAKRTHGRRMSQEAALRDHVESAPVRQQKVAW